MLFRVLVLYLVSGIWLPFVKYIFSCWFYITFSSLWFMNMYEHWEGVLATYLVGLKYLIVDMSFTRRGKNIYLFMCLYEVGEEGGGETASMASSGEK